MTLRTMLDRLAPRLRPNRPAQGFQRWHRLLFSHWEVPASILRPLVDARLSLDDFEGRFFVGIVAFEMRAVRPFQWLPSIPTATDFAEINLRTYVHLDGREPGVFFFSLDAASALVTTAARLGWGLPYFHMDVPTHVDDGTEIEWQTIRRGEKPDVRFTTRYRVEEALPPTSPDSLEFFIAERYQFYTNQRGRLFRARVHHAPYEIHRADVREMSTNFLDAAGLPQTGERLPDYFSPGVDVDVFPLEPV